MSADSRSSRSITLALPPDEHWTLHHVLLHRIDQETTADDTTVVDPPSLEVFQAFEALDAGSTQFSITQLEAIQAVLAEYYHSTIWWEGEQAQLEQLLQHVATLVEANQLLYPQY
ncbi:DUF7853 family protein [Haladaptatus halobius]|uniref:DUF7853 family protein n=1 Tax=Haladaptatus halobius TaxID=2884875 RepID=UPI001D0B5165|nr:hypothetical protein [Haladaptatus halobius]